MPMPLNVVQLEEQIAAFRAAIPDLERIRDYSKRIAELKSEQDMTLANLKTQARTQVEQEQADLILKAQRRSQTDNCRRQKPEEPMKFNARRQS
jgi:hypothetical protein